MNIYTSQSVWEYVTSDGPYRHTVLIFKVNAKSRK